MSDPQIIQRLLDTVETRRDAMRAERDHLRRQLLTSELRRARLANVAEAARNHLTAEPSELRETREDLAATLTDLDDGDTVTEDWANLTAVRLKEREDEIENLTRRNLELETRVAETDRLQQLVTDLTVRAEQLEAKAEWLLAQRNGQPHD